jgi:hypothetical protein
MKSVREGQMILKRVGVGSAAKVAGALYGALGLVLGVILACAALVGAGLGQDADANESASRIFGVFFGVGAVIFVPILYGLIGSAMAAVMAWVYNSLVRITGGLELHLE